MTLISRPKAAKQKSEQNDFVRFSEFFLKIYYFSINGQKGNVIGKLPVDSKKLMIHFLLIAAFCMVIFLLFSSTNFVCWQLNGWTALSAVTILAGVAFTLFELLVIFLQAYIFALLVAVYIELSLHADEH